MYGDDLYTSSEQIKALLRYFVTNLSEITEKDIEEMIKTGTKTEEEGDRGSFQVSVCGRTDRIRDLRQQEE